MGKRERTESDDVNLSFDAFERVELRRDPNAVPTLTDYLRHLADIHREDERVRYLERRDAFYARLRQQAASEKPGPGGSRDG